MAKEITDIVVADTDNEMVSFLFKLDKITRTTCKLCNFENREEIEKVYDEQKKKNYTAIKTLLKNKFDFDISLNAIRNHLIYHHNVVETSDSLQEYADDIERWINIQPNKVMALKARIAILQKEMFTIAQQSADLDIVERRKNAETIKKLSEAILAHEDKLKESVENIKPVKVIFNQLQIILNDEISHVDVKTKQVLSKVLTRLKDKVGTMMVEEK